VRDSVSAGPIQDGNYPEAGLQEKSFAPKHIIARWAIASSRPFRFSVLAARAAIALERAV